MTQGRGQNAVNFQEGAGEIGHILKAASFSRSADAHTFFNQPLGFGAAQQIDGLHHGAAGEGEVPGRGEDPHRRPLPLGQ